MDSEKADGVAATALDREFARRVSRMSLAERQQALAVIDDLLRARDGCGGVLLLPGGFDAVEDG